MKKGETNDFLNWILKYYNILKLNLLQQRSSLNLLSKFYGVDCWCTHTKKKSVSTLAIPYTHTCSQTHTHTHTYSDLKYEKKISFSWS